MLSPRHLLGLFVLLLLIPAISAAAAPPSTIDISLSRVKVRRGETVEFELRAAGNGGSPAEAVRAVLLQPSAGTSDLTLQKAPGSPGVYSGKINLAADALEGMY
ncbi:MAG: hypothetical protein ACRD68_02830, partial [Pyrinomonadaceae bacterium]